MAEIASPQVTWAADGVVTNKARRAPSAREKGRSRLLPAIAGPTLYVCIAFGVMGAAWANPTNTVIGSGGDPLSYLWVFQWPTFAIGHGLNPFFSEYLIAPLGTNLAWSSSTGPGIVLAPLVILLGPVLAYNLLATISLALSAWFAELLILRLVDSRAGAILGGLVYGFSPYLLGHSWGHVTITLAVLPPAALILLHEAFVRQEWHWWTTGGLAGLAVTLQFITFVETLAITAVAVIIVTILLVVQRHHLIREKVAYAWRTLLATGAAFVVLSSYPLWTLLFGAQRLGRGTVEPPDAYVTDLLNFVVPTVTTRFIPGFIASSSAHVTTGVVESGGYIGVGLLLICVFTTVRLWHSLVVRTAAITGFVLAILSLGPRLHVDGTVLNIPLPFAIFDQLPLVGNILAARIMGVTDLSVAVLVAFFIRYLRDLGIWPKLAGTALVAFGLFLQYPVLPVPLTGYSIPRYFTSSGVDRIPQGSVALVAPYDTNGTDDAPQTWQAASGFRFKMPEGYVYVPTPNGPQTGPISTPLGSTMDAIASASPISPTPKISSADRASYEQDLRQWHVQTVIVGPTLNYSQMVHFFQTLLGRPGLNTGGVTVWYHVTEQPYRSASAIHCRSMPAKSIADQVTSTSARTPQPNQRTCS